MSRQTGTPITDVLAKCIPPLHTAITGWLESLGKPIEDITYWEIQGKVLPESFSQQWRICAKYSDGVSFSALVVRDMFRGTATVLLLEGKSDE